MAHHSTPSQRATAVARVIAGESRRKVARETGVATSTVSEWVKEAQSAETERGKEMAQSAESIAEQIERLQEQARLMLLKRVVELVPQSEGIKDVMWAYGVATDKSLLMGGKPTGIHEHRSSDPLDAEIEQLLSEEAARREAGEVSDG